MILKIQVRGQVMRPLIKNALANHSQEFSRFVFFLSEDWDGLTTFAQFRQGDAAYNVYLDSENACYLPPEIEAGKVSLMLYGTGEDVIGTTNAITMCVADNHYVSDAQSTEITESLYQQLVNEVRAVIPSGGSVGQVLTRAANGKTVWSDAGTPTEEQVTTAVDTWLEENVAQETGYVLDSSLTMSNAAPPASAVGDLKSAIEDLEAIPHNVKMAMDTLFSKAAYADADAASSYATFHAWATANPVTSITAVFTQGSATIYDTDSLDTLKQYLTVTATYSDGTTATVTDYTLSGTLAVGTSTITVSYGGKTETFNVTVTGLVLPSGYTRYGYIKRKTTGSLTVNSERWITLNNQQNLDALSMKLTISQEANAPSTTYDQALIGVRSESAYLTSFSVYRRKNSGSNANCIFGVVHGTEWSSNSVLTNNTPNTIEIINTVSSPSRYKVNDESGEINWTSLLNIPYGLTLFGNPQGGTSASLALAASIRIGDIILRKTDGECVGYYVPAVHNDVIGMYDFVSEQFYSTPTASYATISNSACIYSVGDW